MFSFKVLVIPKTKEKKTLRFNISEGNKTEISEYLNIADIHEASVKIVYFWKNDYRLIIQGEAVAEITQECGISLELVRHVLKFNFERLCLTSAEEAKDADDDFDIVATNSVDMGLVFLEELLLKIDPYFKQQDAIFVPISKK